MIFSCSYDRDALIAAARSRNVAIDLHDIAAPDIATLYAQRLVLVRPDGHVAWRGDAVPSAPLALIDRTRGVR